MTDIGEVTAKAQAKQTLRKQARELGLEVDNRWSVETLAEKVVEAQFDAADRADQEVISKSDTWIYLLKGAWPTSQQKHFAGEVIKVPEEMAFRWYEAGAARPARPTEIPDAE
ncbi:hypothetical protein [Mesorhizobium sp. Z1-4]|uniref:hypothetical protein n=1 Tax=Mesorhizobium sp. Z1-4 TaxID=2448478 RepID=UPI000FDBF80B|nr:hypothetical protein [Mesorhizobium sp. Z1-4]